MTTWNKGLRTMPRCIPCFVVCFYAGVQTKSAWSTGWLLAIKASHLKTRAINRRCPGRDSDCSVLGVPPQLALPEQSESRPTHRRVLGLVLTCDALTPRNWPVLQSDFYSTIPYAEYTANDREEPGLINPVSARQVLVNPLANDQSK